jgi:hypothetical protein
MTRFKTYVRGKGTMLECDYRAMGINLDECGTDHIIVFPEQGKILKHHKTSGWCDLTFHRDGRFTVSHATPETVAAAINKGLPWWEQIDLEEVAAVM